MKEKKKATTAAIEMSATDAEALRKRVKTAQAAHAKASIELAHALYDVMYGSTKNAKGQIVYVYEAWGYPSFDEYAEHELTWHMGTARSYVRVWDELFVRRGVDPEVLPDSIQQLRTLAKVSGRVANLGDLKKWITKSKEMSCCEFDAEVESEFGFGKGKIRSLSFAFPVTRIKAANKALNDARNVYNVNSRGAALDKILADWAASHSRASQRQAG